MAEEKCKVRKSSTYADTTRVWTNKPNTNVRILESDGQKRRWEGDTDEDGRINISTTSSPQGDLTCEVIDD